MQTENVVPFAQKGQIKLDYKTLNSENFNQALSVLAGQAGFSNFQAAYNVAKIAKQFWDELKIAREIYNKWSDTYIVKDEKGKPVFATTQNPYSPYEIKAEDMPKFEEEMKKFLETEVFIKALPIQVYDLGTVKLSPSQMLALEAIFDPAAFAVNEPLNH